MFFCPGNRRLRVQRRLCRPNRYGQAGADRRHIEQFEIRVRSSRTAEGEVLTLSAAPTMLDNIVEYSARLAYHRYVVLLSIDPPLLN
jgi:hypothetical protein